MSGDMVTKADLAASEERLTTAWRADLAASEESLEARLTAARRADLAASEERLTAAWRADLAAAEDRMRAEWRSELTATERRIKTQLRRQRNDLLKRMDEMFIEIKALIEAEAAETRILFQGLDVRDRIEDHERRLTALETGTRPRRR